MQKINIEEQKQIQIEILKEVKKICDSNNLNYYLGGGTLLGAVRHKGYIPWDDDIDIMMLRKDYEKLLEIFNKQCDKKYKLLCYKNTKDYYYPFTKIVNIQTKLEETKLRPIAEMGLFIDVFPIDFLPEEDKKITKIFKSYARWYSLVSVYQAKPEKLTAKSKSKMIIKKIILPILEKFKLYSKILKKIDKIIIKYNNTSKVACITGRYQEKEIMPSSYIAEYKLVDFEGEKYKIPAGYDEYLTKHYGDYMELPPEEKRVKEHDNSAYWKEG